MATTYISKIKQIGGSEEYVIKDAEARSELATKAPLASPSLTGTPTAPTPAQTSNGTQIATTAFVKTLVTNSIPQSLGHTLTIGSYSFNGSEDVTIPVYDGSIS